MARRSCPRPRTRRHTRRPPPPARRPSPGWPAPPPQSLRLPSTACRTLLHVRIHCTSITGSVLFQSIPAKSNGSAKGSAANENRCDVDLAGVVGAGRRGRAFTLPENVPYRCRADNYPSQKMLDSDAATLPRARERLRLDTGPRLAQPRVRHETDGRHPDDDSDDRTADGAGAEPPHVPPDGEDSRLRGAGERALQER